MLNNERKTCHKNSMSYIFIIRKTREVKRKPRKERCKIMWHTLKPVEVEEGLCTDIVNGLAEDEVKKRQEKYGKNVLKEKKKESIIVKFVKQFNDFMIIILIIASIISAMTSYMQGENDYIDSIIIIAIVILNAIMGIIQEERA